MAEAMAPPSQIRLQPSRTKRLLPWGESARRVARRLGTGSDIGPLPPDARTVDAIDGTVIVPSTLVIPLSPLPERGTVSERGERWIHTVQSAASSVVLRRCACRLAARPNVHVSAVRVDTDDRRQFSVVSRTLHTHAKSSRHHAHSSQRHSERSRRTT